MSNLEEQNGGAWNPFKKTQTTSTPAAPMTPPATPTGSEEAKPKGFLGKLGSSIASSVSAKKQALTTSVKASTQALGRKIGPGENIIESGLADQYDLMAGNTVAYKKNCLISVNCAIGGKIRDKLKVHIQEGARKFKDAMDFQSVERIVETQDVKSLFGIDAALKASAAKATTAQKIYTTHISQPITFAEEDTKEEAGNVKSKIITDPKKGDRAVHGLPCGVFFKKGDKGTGDILGEGLITKIDAPSKLFYVTVTNINDEPGAEGAVDGASAKKATFVKENIIVKFDQLCIGGDVARLAYSTCSAPKPFDKPVTAAVGGGLNSYVDELLSETSEINDQFGGRKKTKTKKNKNNDNLSVSTEDGLCE
jgi:hypothetical protein